MRLTGHDLREADLQNALLHGADLTAPDLAGADLRDATFDRHTRWPAGFDPRAAGARSVE